MEDQLITLETAKLAKAKGFKVWTKDSFTSDNDEGLFPFHPECHTRLNFYGRPTQSLLRKWLRDEKDMDIQIEPVWGDEDDNYSKEYCPWVAYTEEEMKSNPETEEAEYYLTYEAALEAALQEALNTL